METEQQNSRVEIPLQEAGAARFVLVKRITQALFGFLVIFLAYFYYCKWTEKVVESILVCFFVGGVGATVAMIHEIRKAASEKIMIWVNSWYSTGLPIFYGGILAVVLYLVFMAEIFTGVKGEGIIKSNFFPNLCIPTKGDTLTTDVIFAIRPMTVGDFGKLLVWSFIAGYSENFMVGVLNTIESKVNLDKKDDK